MDATTLFYHLAHRVGFHPWEEAPDHPPFAERMAELLDREERERGRPLGRALDVGCGSGIWTVELARRGWEVTGVDLVAPALDRARERARSEGVDARLVEGDVTDLRGSGVARDYRLVLDTGTFHGLTSRQRQAMGREVTAVTAPDATVLLLVWTPRWRAFLPRGASREEVEAAFPAWEVVEVTDADPDPPPIMAFLKAEECWYRLRREGGG